MTVSIVAKNASQGSQTILRGGRLTEVRGAGTIEVPINQGGLLAYEVPEFKTALIRGSFTITDFGTNNTFMQVEMFDTQSGRLIPIARGTVLGQTVVFEMKITQLRPASSGQDQEVQFHGNGATGDGVAEWFAFIEEKPN